MLYFVATQSGFFLLVSLFLAGAIGSLVLQKSNTLSHAWSSLFSVAGSLLGIVFAVLCLFAKDALLIKMALPYSPLFSLAFTVDKLSGFFLLIISIVALCCSVYGIGYVKHFFGKYNIGSLGFFYNLFIAGMMLVVSSSNALLFLFSWEIMSLASYFLVVYEYKEESNVKAGFKYFVMTHIGTAFIMVAFLLLLRFTGSLDFEGIQAGIFLVPPWALYSIFVCSLIGFGVKAGIIPLHTWLPDAHPAAPSHVSALMSGVMIKTGIYMMIRMFLGLLGGGLPLWAGLLVLGIGAVSSLLGVLYALTEHDIKRLLAFHSIENIGIILLGLGSGMVFLALHMPGLAAIGIVAALFHTLNHATFKSLLFLSAGSIVSTTHTRNIEEMGGLIKRMPYTAFFFLLGAMAISALPPFNGFFSEWLTFQSLFQGVDTLDVIPRWAFLLSAGFLALTSGLAVACFVKAFGVTFLARPRSKEAEYARESSWPMILGMGAMGTLIVLFGVFAGRIIAILQNIAGTMIKNANPSPLSTSSFQSIQIGSFSSVSSLAVFLIIGGAIIISIIGALYVIRRNQKIVLDKTWDCGVDLGPRLEITGTGFSRSLILIFKGLLKPTKQVGVEYADEEMRYLPKARTLALGLKNVYALYLENPLIVGVTWIADHVKRIQNGNVNMYIVYILCALAMVLFASRF